MLANKTCIVTTSLFSCSRYSHESATLAKEPCVVSSQLFWFVVIVPFVVLSGLARIHRLTILVCGHGKKIMKPQKDDIMEAAAPHKFKLFLDSRMNFVYSYRLFEIISYKFLEILRLMIM